MDFEINGETLKRLVVKAEAAGLQPETMLNAILHCNLDIVAEANDVRQQKFINQGNGGFHIATIVTDGYGYFIAEDMRGEEIARVKTDPSDESDIDCVKPMQEVVRRFAVNSAHAQAVSES